MARQEALLRDMLGQWVSELEPVVVYGRDFLAGPKGLGVKDDPTGYVAVKNPAWRSGFMDMLHDHRPNR